MSDLSRSVPSAGSLVAESVRRYREYFPGIARVFLPVFTVFAAGQIGMALWGEPTTFSGYMARAFVLAGIGVLEIVLQAIATGALLSAPREISRLSVAGALRAGAAIFWPLVWVVALVVVALSVVPAAAVFLAPFAVKFLAAVTGAAFGESLTTAISAALYGLSTIGILAAAAGFVLASRLALALPLVASRAARGVAALEMSAALSDGRAWTVVSRLAAGLAATAAAIAPFALVLWGSGSPAAPWAWVLFAAGYLLVAVPFALIFLARLAETLRDTVAERVAARGPRPWVRWIAWAGAASWAFLLVGAFLS